MTGGTDDEPRWKLMIGGKITFHDLNLDTTLKEGIKQVSALLPDRQVFVVLDDDGDWSIRTNLPISNHEIASVFR